jgi:branched-chain amino acid transport system permease protein
MTYIVQGLFVGATYGLVALGFVIIYSAIKAFQFAHGAVTMLASYLFLISYDHTHSLAAALVIALASMVVLSLIFSIAGFEPLLGKHLPSLMIGLGALLIIDQIAGAYFFAGNPTPYPSNLQVKGSFELFGTTINWNQVMVFGVAVALMLLLDTLFRRTRIGIQMRALSDNPVSVQLCAVSTKKLIRIAFIIAGISAAIGGVLVGLLLDNISPSTGDTLTTAPMAAVLVAGPTSMRGAVGASVLIGIAQSLAVGYLSPTYSDAVAYIVIVIILLFRPQGLFSPAKA